MRMGYTNIGHELINFKDRLFALPSWFDVHGFFMPAAFMGTFERTCSTRTAAERPLSLSAREAILQFGSFLGGDY